MISRISIIAAVGLICFACAIVGERRSTHEVAIKCTKAGWNADASALGADEGPVDMAELLEDGCIYLREFSRCIVEVDPDEYSNPFPNIVHFLVAYHWQHNVLAEKAGLCKNLLVNKLKKIASQQDVMKEENLKNVENDEYADCAGKAMRRCMIRAETLMREGISQDFLAAITDYISCYEKEGVSCDAEILKHFIAVMKAYRRHLEAKNGEYGKLVDKIPLPPQ